MVRELHADNLVYTYTNADPNDPLADLYDVDDGRQFDILTLDLLTFCPHIESTVITLGDWYHTLARLGNRFPYVS